MQNTEQAEGYVFRDIENVTIDRGLPGKDTDMPAPVDDDTYTISQLYRFVKGLKREDRKLCKASVRYDVGFPAIREADVERPARVTKQGGNGYLRLCVVHIQCKSVVRRIHMVFLLL